MQLSAINEGTLDTLLAKIKDIGKSQIDTTGLSKDAASVAQLLDLAANMDGQIFNNKAWWEKMMALWPIHPQTQLAILKEVIQGMQQHMGRPRRRRDMYYESFVGDLGKLVARVQRVANKNGAAAFTNRIRNYQAASLYVQRCMEYVKMNGPEQATDILPLDDQQQQPSQQPQQPQTNQQPQPNQQQSAQPAAGSPTQPAQPAGQQAQPSLSNQLSSLSREIQQHSDAVRASKSEWDTGMLDNRKRIAELQAKIAKLRGGA